jgi:hypothetical protein
MIESSTYSRWPFNDRIETAPRKAKESGSYTVTGLVNTLSLAEVTTVISDWTAAGWLIPVRIEAGGEPSIATLRSHRSDDASSVTSSIRGPVKARLIARECHGSKRGGPKQDKEDKEDKKGRKEDTTQKKLEQFFSNNSLQLTN